MKYKIYKEGQTIKNYKVKRNYFNKKHEVILSYVDSKQKDKLIFNTQEEFLIWEQLCLQLMDIQINDLLNADDEFCDYLEKMVDTENRNLIKGLDALAFILPIGISFLYKNPINLLLTFPIILLNKTMNIINPMLMKLDIADDLYKYELFIENKDLFENYGMYVTDNRLPINSNNIDKYNLSKIREYLNELKSLAKNENEIQKMLQKVKG